MDRELIDSAWRVLPAEFKRVVKAHYAGLNAAYKAYLSKDSLTNEECDRCKAIREKISIYSMYFGHYNLTSDAEGEVELLHVTRQKVLGLYANAKKLHDLYTSATCINTKESQQIDICKGVMSILDTLFGSKCLPDENSSNVERLEKNDEPELFEQKYKQGDKVFNKLDCNVYEVICRTGFNHYALKDFMSDVHEDFLRPYTEPKEESLNLSQNIANCDKEFENVLKDSFSKERRLNIAAMIAQGIMANSNPQMADMNVERVVDLAILTADTLIAECCSPIN